MAIAKMLSEQRSGRAARLPQNMRISEKGPSVLSFISGIRLLHCNIREIWRSKYVANRIFSRRLARLLPSCNKKYFCRVKVLHTKVENLVERTGKLWLTRQIST
jgi:hypothetical protein